MGDRYGRTVRDLRRGNRAAVLRRLYFGGPLSRHQLGPATGLSPGSVSNVVGELMSDGLLEEAGSVESDGGRPRTLLRVSPESGRVVGIDIGETRVRVELFDVALTEIARAERPLDVGRRDPDHVIARLAEAFDRVMIEGGASPEWLLGVGVGVPGIVTSDEVHGALVHGQTIGWVGVAVERLVRSAAHLPEHVPVLVDNGAETLGQAEMWFGHGRGERDVAVVLLGSGVGVSVFADGSSAGIGEWGHSTLRVRGRRCRCGGHGCLEAYTGAEAMVRRWRRTGGEIGPDADGEHAFGALLAAASREGNTISDTAASTVVSEAVEYLGAGIATLVNLFLPTRVLIGGWAGLLLGRHRLELVQDSVARYALRYPADRVSVAEGGLGPDAVTVGAATLPLARFLDEGGRCTATARAAHGR
ncbi:Sugar kinase of the NBD/HSP70 family, may contain an N-terminal HTH domain [Actinopolyspora alba]|uniref:Sugar kinase of the NBD/HSP70 family, may contain an N-terminal HTH domain n=1 Tax=Actinopolyspora alba TaxID=673379 RepID=A0A1I2CC50_9ACTN|nr:ROK family transcriptional regulator [Actinopolyspora alba]SFE65919.1 Sugar kinase of the NBD/HSP70 family, may contain an N-terminal HTH domain [Actinopolyspora alba]